MRSEHSDRAAEVRPAQASTRTGRELWSAMPTIQRALRANGIPPGELADAVQDVFVVLAGRWSKLSLLLPAQLCGYAASVSRGVAAKRWKREFAQRQAVGAIHADGIGLVAHADPAEAMDLRRSLLALKLCDTKLADSLISVEVVGLTHEELAAKHLVPLGTAKTRLRKARNTLKSIVQTGSHQRTPEKKK